jgi:hypothetical protein
MVVDASDWVGTATAGVNAVHRGLCDVEVAEFLLIPVLCALLGCWAG